MSFHDFARKIRARKGLECVLFALPWLVETWRGSGRQAFAATRRILGRADSHCQACYSTYMSLPCCAKTLGVMRLQRLQRSALVAESVEYLQSCSTHFLMSQKFFFWCVCGQYLALCLLGGVPSVHAGVAARKHRSLPSRNKSSLAATARRDLAGEHLGSHVRTTRTM